MESNQQSQPAVQAIDSDMKKRTPQTDIDPREVLPGEVKFSGPPVVTPAESETLAAAAPVPEEPVAVEESVVEEPVAVVEEPAAPAAVAVPVDVFDLAGSVARICSSVKGEFDDLPFRLYGFLACFGTQKGYTRTVNSLSQKFGVPEGDVEAFRAFARNETADAETGLGGSGSASWAFIDHLYNGKPLGEACSEYGAHFVHVKAMIDSGVFFHYMGVASARAEIPSDVALKYIPEEAYASAVTENAITVAMVRKHVKAEDILPLIPEKTVAEYLGEHIANQLDAKASTSDMLAWMKEMTAETLVTVLPEKIVAKHLTPEMYKSVPASEIVSGLSATDKLAAVDDEMFMRYVPQNVIATYTDMGPWEKSENFPEELRKK